MGKILRNNKLKIFQANIVKVIVITIAHIIETEIYNFIQDNNIRQLNIDSTDMYHNKPNNFAYCNVIGIGYFKKRGQSGRI